jgi:hypothetical protein
VEDRTRPRLAHGPEGRGHEPEHARDGGFFRLRRLRTVPSYCGRQSRKSRKRQRQLQDRRLELNALEAELRDLCRSEWFLALYDPAAKSPELAASIQSEAR